MFTLIYAEITQNAARFYKVYLTNILSILLIVLLYAYIDGSMRQLELRNTVFAGEVVVNFKPGTDLLLLSDVQSKLASSLSSVKSVSRKVRANVQFSLPGVNNTGKVEILGVDFENDINITGYLTLQSGTLPRGDSDLLIPSHLLRDAAIKVGDPVRLSWITSSGKAIVAVFRVSGIYNSPNISIFNTPPFLSTQDGFVKNFQPKTSDWELGLFFAKGVIPPTINRDIKEIVGIDDASQLDRIKSKHISSFDVLDLPVQFNIFLLLMISLTIVVVVTFVMLVNFNIYMILFRKRQKDIGILMSFGVKSWKICLTLFIETIIQLTFSALIAFALAYMFAVIGRHSLATGTLETMFVLLSGTNHVDFYIRPEGIIRAVVIILVSVTISQLPVLIKVLFASPIESMRKG